MDARSGWLFGLEALEQGSGPAEIAHAIVEVMLAHSPTRDPGQFPQLLRVEDPETAIALRSRLGSDVTVEVGPTTEIDAVLRSMARHFGRGDDQGSFLEGGRVTPETIGRFFEAAAAVYRLAPWEIVAGDSQVLGLDAPSFGVQSACLSITGGLGEHHGVLIFDSVDDFSDMAFKGTEGADEVGSPGVPVLSINFDARKELPRGLARETKRYAWPVAGPRAYPWILSTDADGRPYPLVERDYVYATAVLETLAVFLNEEAAVFDDEPESPITRTVVNNRLPGAPSVTLTAPHPDADWEWLGGGPVEAAFWDEADDLADRFVAGQVRSGRSTEWLRSAQAVIDDLFRFRIDTAGEAPLGWTAKQVEEYLLEYFPDMGAIPSEDSDTVPEHLDAFFAWLDDGGYESPATVRDIRDRIARRRSAFLERAHDPAPGSPRRLGEELRKSGINPSDEESVAAFVSEWAAAVESKAAPPRPPSGKRWKWTTGSPAPAPEGPCPCGSGMRYRKCCMPR